MCEILHAFEQFAGCFDASRSGNDPPSSRCVDRLGPLASLFDEENSAVTTLITSVIRSAH
jgi:hypothetical protein